MNIFKKIFFRLSNIKLYFKTKIKCKNISKINHYEINGFYYRGAEYKDLINLSRIYKELNNLDLSKTNKKLLKNCKNKLIVIVEEVTEEKVKLVGMDMYYINKKDFKYNRMHEGFIGVLPHYEGKGLATNMRKIAIDHFKSNGFNGISTRISKNNKGSLLSAKKLGFKIVDEYYDENVNEERCYLILDFKVK